MKKREQIKNYLLQGKKLNGLKAFELFNTISLPQHIHALKNNHGIAIESEMMINSKTGTKYAQYYIER